VTEIFFLPENFHTSAGANPTSYSMGKGTRGVKSKIMRKWSYTSVPLYALVAWTVTLLCVFIDKCMRVQREYRYSSIFTINLGTRRSR
jgi:hypothetical protein